jgi:alpha-mannosidase
LRGAIEQHWRFLGEAGRMDVRLRFILDAEADWLRIHVLGDNAARDHRLRIRLRTDIEDALTFSDAAFACVQREAMTEVPAEVARHEMPLRTAPLHRYVSHFNSIAGVTVFSDGLTEYESENGAISITLLRSVGELSRSDLLERPGNAGWPAPTPEAQCIGPFEAQLAMMLHGPRTSETIDQIERTADDVLYPLAGETLRSALRMPTPKHGIALDGQGLAFCCAKESEDGEWIVLRCLNLLDQEATGSWKLGRPLREASLARLDETPTGKAILVEDTVTFTAAPRAVVTILVR